MTPLYERRPWEDIKFLKAPTTLFHSIQVPALISSSFSIWKNLKFYAKTGLYLSFMIEDSNANMKLNDKLIGNTIDNGVSYQHSLSYRVHVNTVPTAYELLFHAGIGIGYEFPIGIGISLNAAFSQGFIITSEILTYYDYLCSSESNEYFTSGYENISFKTNYYSVNLGLFYKFRGKIKNRN